MIENFDDYLPGDPTPKQKLAQILRVNYAGEYGAKRIYQGQLSVLKDHDEINHMLEQELTHLAFFENEMRINNVRPSLLTPLWDVGGYLMGKVTALMGEKSAMACTEAVEEVIDQHYSQQIEQLKSYNLVLANKLEQFRQEELEHRDHAIKAGSKQTQGYSIITKVIKCVSRLAIKMAKKY